MGNLHSEKLVSTDFVNCIKEDVAAERILPDDVRFTSFKPHIYLQGLFIFMNSTSIQLGT
jgi:hypothetical protein